LVEAKALVKHGEWIPWLKSNFKGSQRTAYRYTELASNLPCVASLEPRSINEALRMIAGEDEEDEEEKPEEEPQAELFDEPEDDIEPQHGEVEDEQPQGEQEQEEARAVAVEIVEEEDAEPMFPVPQIEPSAAAIEAGENAEKDSEMLWTLKKNWKKATKKDRANFLNWTKTNA
jgi:hypothetical protein